MTSTYIVRFKDGTLLPVRAMCPGDYPRSAQIFKVDDNTTLWRVQNWMSMACPSTDVFQLWTSGQRQGKEE
jgi:hypothetical protein